jgi:hypothetical protein
MRIQFFASELSKLFDSPEYLEKNYDSMASQAL